MLISNIYCSKKIVQDKIVANAKLAKLNVKIDQYNLDMVEISGKKSKYDPFMAIIEKNTDVTIFSNSVHPIAKKSIFRSHVRINPVKSSPSALAVADYGRTAEWFGKYYNFPTAGTLSSPVIAVISLGGGYSLEDLNYYWTNICGKTVDTLPVVLNAVIGQKSIPLYTGDPNSADLENMLDMEIVGAVCPPKSKLIFVSAPNSFLGFLQAFSACVNGISIGGTILFPTIVSCSWGATEANCIIKTTVKRVTTTNNYMTAFNEIFAKGNAKGMTFLAASGDNGSNDGYTLNGSYLDFLPEISTMSKLY